MDMGQEATETGRKESLMDILTEAQRSIDSVLFKIHQRIEVEKQKNLRKDQGIPEPIRMPYLTRSLLLPPLMYNWNGDRRMEIREYNHYSLIDKPTTWAHIDYNLWAAQHNLYYQIEDLFCQAEQTRRSIYEDLALFKRHGVAMIPKNQFILNTTHIA